MLPRPIHATQPLKIYDRLQAFNNFYWVSGDLVDDAGGWVNNSFRLVEKYIDEIFDNV
jgi:hypothetical protein